MPDRFAAPDTGRTPETPPDAGRSTPEAGPDTGSGTPGARLDGGRGTPGARLDGGRGTPGAGPDIGRGTLDAGSGRARFAGRVALVTGGGSGIGRNTARALAAEGATVVVAGRDKSTLEETGGMAIVADVTVEEEVAALVDSVRERFGRLDVAVNNAGVFGGGMPLADMPSPEWDRVVATNLTGVFLTMKYEIALMRATGGAIVNVASNIGAHGRRPGLGAYAATKAAVSALTRNTALEYIRDGIRINAVSPGPADTTMSLHPGETPADRAARLSDALPIGRVGSLDEVTSAILWLAADESAFTVGHDLVIDGGATA